jgi:hypothetical protein
MSTSQQRREGLLTTLRRFICRLVCYEPPQPPPPPPKRRLRTFEPGQVAILAEYPPQLELTPQQIIDKARAQLNQLDFYRRAEVRLTPNRVVILRGRERTLATIFGDVPAARENPTQLIRFISQLHRTIKKPPLDGRPSDGGVEQNPKGDTPNQSSDSQPSGGEPGTPPTTTGAAQLAATGAPAPAARTLTPDQEGFDLRAASPNWYASGTKYIIGGGPGGWPVADTPIPTQTVPEPWAFSLPVELQAPASGAQVEIAILDTVPRMIDLQNAHAAWVGTDEVEATLTPNPLLASLLASSADRSFNVADQSLTPDTVGTPDQLDVIYLPNLPITDIEEHAYPMPSHGLFIAGIIRSIAPHAKLRLIQVLNDEGGGSLLSITQGLAHANHPSRGTTPLVINCSFAMRTPRVGDPPDAVDLVDVPQTEIDELTQLLSDQFAQTNQAFDLAIAAAAGNHGGGPVHPPARHPAAFPFVAGVAALKQNDPELNVYSDLADDQIDEGFAAFGGEQSSVDPTLTDLQKGVLGVFIDTLPRLDSVTNTVADDPNTSGWARWAGTSFATPIVSALLANLIANGANAEVAISSLSTTLNDLGVGKNVPATQP